MLRNRSALGVMPPKLGGSPPGLDPEKTGPPLHKKRPIGAIILKSHQSERQLNHSKRPGSIAPIPT